MFQKRIRWQVRSLSPKKRIWIKLQKQYWKWGLTPDFNDWKNAGLQMNLERCEFECWSKIHSMRLGEKDKIF